MTQLLFAALFWYGVFAACCGAIMLAGFAWFLIVDWWQDDPREPRAYRVPPRPIRPARIFDQDDPLERAFELDCAPDPRWQA